MATVTILIFWFLGLITFFIFLFFVPVNLWLTALSAGVYVSLFKIIKMRTARVPPRIIVDSLINARKSGIKLSDDRLSEHYLAGGHVPHVVRAMISAKNMNMALSFDEAAKIDLAGVDAFYLASLSKPDRLFDIDSIIELVEGQKYIWVNINYRMMFNSIKIENLTKAQKVYNRISEICLDELNSFDDIEVLKRKPSLLSNRISQKLITNDISANVDEIKTTKLIEISENTVREMGFEKEFEKENKKIDLDNSLNLKVGDVGKIWLQSSNESAFAVINRNHCKVFLEPRLKEEMKVKVKKIYEGEVYVDIIED
ncbi:MAG: hypothetical protein CMO01_16395 [Thalassobius sp.]|nr:hypothetical protein [Thalassovita sp.]